MENNKLKEDNKSLSLNSAIDKVSVLVSINKVITIFPHKVLHI